MDFVFAPSRNRESATDLTVYSSINTNASPDGNRTHALACCFSVGITKKVGWVQGDRLIVEWSQKDKSLTFVRVGLDDPRPAYKVTFSPVKSKKQSGSARVRLGCPAEAITSVLGKVDARRTFSYFESNGSKTVFVANN